MGEFLQFVLGLLILLYALFLCSWLGRSIGVTVGRSPDFNYNLEILRGLAAFSVFLAHTTMYFGYLAPRYIVSTYTGAFGVNVFFMLTAYLFWKQVVTGKIDFNKFYVKRIYRLVPIALTVITAVSLIDFLASSDNSLSINRFSALVRNYMFGFGGVNNIFSENMYLRINTIWTLKWEWLFYLTLPVLAIWPRVKTLLIALFLSVFVFTDVTKIFGGESDAVFFIAFFLGAISVYIEGRINLFCSKWLSILFLICSVSLMLISILYGYKDTVHYKSFLCTISGYFMFLFFLICPFNFSEKIASALQLLGKVSYSFYLWHLSVNFYGIYLAKKFLVKNEAHFFASPYNYFLFGAVMISISLAISFVTYKYIEEYFLYKSHAQLLKNKIAKV